MELHFFLSSQVIIVCLAGIMLQFQAELNTPMNWNYNLYFYALHKTLEFYGFN